MKFDLSSWLHWLYFIIAFGMSCYYGYFACEIHGVDKQNKSTHWKVHQFWFNFLGAAVGWLAMWAVLGSVVVCATGNCTNSISISSALLFILAFLGVTGHLPMSLFGLIGGLQEFVAKLLSVIGGKP
jgi:hypothetical protein